MIRDAVKFNIGDIIYRKLKPSEPIQVTGILFRQNNVGYYCTCQDNTEHFFHECELTAEKEFVIK